MPETEELTGPAVQAAQQVRMTVGRLRRRLREDQDRDEVTPSQVAVLSRLDREGPLTASAIASAEGVRPQSVAAWLGALEERALVVRRPDPDDGRRALVSVSEAGRALLDHNRSIGDEWLARALQDRLDATERETVIAAMALLERVISR